MGSWISTKAAVEKGQQRRQESTSDKSLETRLFTAQQNQHLLHGSRKARGGGLPEYQLVTGAQWYTRRSEERASKRCLIPSSSLPGSGQEESEKEGGREGKMKERKKKERERKRKKREGKREPERRTAPPGAAASVFSRENSI